MIKHTIISQRSFTNSWACNSSLSGFPSGVLSDISITIPASNSSVIYLTQARVDGTEITLRFRDENNVEIGSITTSNTQVPILLDSPDNIIGHVLLGYIPTTQGELLNGTNSKIQINPALIRKYVNEDTPKTHRLIVTVDGQDIIDEVLTSDLILSEGSGLHISDGVVSRIDDVAVGSVSQITKDTAKLIYTINNVTPDSQGKVNIKLLVPKVPIDAQPTIRNKGSYISIDSTDSRLVELLKPVDIIDSYIAPEGVREFTYYPLDDAYMTETTLGSVRNVMENLGYEGAAEILHSVEFIKPGNLRDSFTTAKVDIDTLNNLYDSQDTTNE